MYETELQNYPYSSNHYAVFGYDAAWVLASALDKAETQLKEKNMTFNSFSYKNAEFAQILSKVLLHTSTNGISVSSILSSSSSSSSPATKETDSRNHWSLLFGQNGLSIY